MSARVLRGRIAAVVGAALLAAAGCDNPSGPSQNALALAGTWQGSALLPNGFGATMTLQQNGAAVSGTLRIAGVMGETPLTGTVTNSTRTMTWQVNYGCEIWTGTLTVASGSREMDGPLQTNRTGCVPAENSGSGTLTLDKQ